MPEDSTPSDAGSSGNRIVVGVDGSARSKDALRWAARVAAATGDVIEAVTTWAYPAGIGWTTVPDDWNPSADAEKALSAAADEVFGADRPAGLRLVVRQGGAAQVLLDHSEGAELLVVGSRGLGGFAGLLLGSVSRNCAEHAHCAVLVVHGPPKG